MKVLLICCVFCFLFFSTHALGGPTDIIVDQSQEGYDGYSRIFDVRPICQTFTPAVSAYLVGIAVHLTHDYDQKAPATISIVGTKGDKNSPDTDNVLWQLEFPDGFPVSGDWYEIMFDLQVAPSLTEGFIYGILFESPDSVWGNPDVGVSVNFSSDYDRGQLWETWEGGEWTVVYQGTGYRPDADMAFKTYMSGIPEPATIFFLVGGSLIFTIRRKALPK